jgi:hypothetical protein
MSKGERNWDHDDRGSMSVAINENNQYSNKSYIDILFNRLTPWCKLPHIIMATPSKEPE